MLEKKLKGRVLIAPTWEFLCPRRINKFKFLSSIGMSGGFLVAWNENYFHGQKLFENSFSVFILFPSVHTRNPGFQKICMGLVNLKPEQNSWNVTDELHCVPCHIKTKEDRAHLFFFKCKDLKLSSNHLGRWPWYGWYCNEGKALYQPTFLFRSCLFGLVEHMDSREWKNLQEWKAFFC